MSIVLLEDHQGCTVYIWMFRGNPGWINSWVPFARRSRQVTSYIVAFPPSHLSIQKNTYTSLFFSQKCLYCRSLYSGCPLFSKPNDCIRKPTSVKEIILFSVWLLLLLIIIIHTLPILYLILNKKSISDSGILY